MVASVNKPLFPYDIAFTGQMDALGKSAEQVASSPVDYSRRGGASLQQRGDMYGALYDAALKASAGRQQQEQAREMAWGEARRRKEALARKMNAQNAANLISGIGGMASDALRQGVKVGGRRMTEEDLGDKFTGLLEGGQIEEVMKRGPYDPDNDPELFYGTGEYKYTPKGAFSELHRGPYWWERPGSTGGWGR